MNSTASIHHFLGDGTGRLTASSPVSITMTATVKTTIVDALTAVPSYRTQRTFAAIVRFVWPGFRGA